LSGNIFDVYIKPYFLEGKCSCLPFSFFVYLIATFL
jgi:hypothetical protein